MTLQTHISATSVQPLTATRSVVWLREQFGWMGSHSGYDQLCRVMSEVLPLAHISSWRDVEKRRSKVSRGILRHLARDAQVSPFYGITSTAAEVATLWHCFWKKPDVVHITYIENHLGILPQYKRQLSFKAVGTCHQPSSWWRLKHPHPESLSSLDALIVLARQDIPYFQQFLGNRVHFIPHGIDTQFFHPDLSQFDASSPRFIFSGSWLRDLKTLSLVVDRVLAANSAIQFDMIMPRSKRNNEYVYHLARHSQLNWYAGISDRQLRQLYQQASGFVLPLIDCTANNALLEAMACGLPIISNDVGGIRDYTEPSFATLLPVGDIDGFANAIFEIADSPQLRRDQGALARQFAEQKFNWPIVAQQTLNLYHQVSHEDCLH